MKKIALILTGAFLSVSTMSAMAFTSNETAVIKRLDDKKTKVEKSQLPEEVRKGFEESQYKDWEIKEAFKVQDEMTNEIHYELHLASAMDASNVKSVSFNEQGEIIEGSEMGATEQETQPGLEQGSEQQQQGEQQQPGIETQPQQGSEQPSQQGQY